MALLMGVAEDHATHTGDGGDEVGALQDAVEIVDVGARRLA